MTYPASPPRHAPRGHHRLAQIEAGEYVSLEGLAKAVGCDRTHVGRMLRLTRLTPDIIEAILRGDEPDGLSLEKLRKNLSVRWEEQRKEYGRQPDILLFRHARVGRFQDGAVRSIPCSARIRTDPSPSE